MKLHLVSYVVDMFSEGKSSKATARPAREVPKLTDRQVAFHSGTSKSGRFTLANAQKLYAKPKATK